MLSSKKLKYSNFFVTVNLNEAGISKTRVKDLADFCEMIMYSPHWQRWIQRATGKGSKLVRFTPAEYRDIKNIRARVGLEANGDTNKSLHAHIVVEITHDTMVRLNTEGLRQLCNEYLGSGANVHSRFIKGDGQGLEHILRYASKTCGEVDVERKY